MTIEQGDPHRPDSRRRRFQYSLRTLFVVTTVFAVACSIFFALPGWIAVVATLCFVISTAAVLTVVLVYDRGYMRTFCLGALIPAGVCLLPVAIVITGIMLEGPPVFLSRLNEQRLTCLLLLVMYCALVVGDGWLAVFVRRLVEARQQPPARRSQPAEEAPEPGDTHFPGGNVSDEDR